MTREQAALRVALTPGIPPTRLAVVLAMLRHGVGSTAGLVVNAPQSQVAADAGVTDRTVRAVVADLVALGVVSERGRCVTFAGDFDPAAMTGKPERSSGNRNVVPETGACFRNVLPETGTTIRKPERASGSGDGTALAIRAQAPARDSLSEQIMIYKREVVVESGAVRAHEPTHARETPAPEAAPPAPPPPPEAMGSKLAPDADPDGGRLACAAWERALGVMTLPGGHVDALKAAYAAHGLDVVVEAADRLAAYLVENPRSRSFAVRMPRIIADRVADVIKARAAPAKGNPNLREMSTCPKFWEAQAAIANARLPAHAMPTPEELEAIPW